MQRMSRTVASLLAVVTLAVLVPLGGSSPASAARADHFSPPDYDIFPAAPTNLRVEETGFNSDIFVVWDAVRSADKYNIYVDGSYDRTVTDTRQFYPNVTASYTVVAVNDVWGTFSPHSETLEVTKPQPPKGVPDIPVNLRYYRFTNSDDGVLQWDPVRGIQKYNVYVDGSYDRTVTSEFALYPWSTATYTVVAVNDAANEFSPQSEPLTVHGRESYQ